jgi:acyl carrier protein
MIANQARIMTDIVALLGALAKDWEYSGTITPQTLLFEDLGFESLDVVVLGASIQEHYGQHMPFAEFLSEIGQREDRSMTVGELAAFVQQQLDHAPTGGPV